MTKTKMRTIKNDLNGFILGNGSADCRRNTTISIYPIKYPLQLIIRKVCVLSGAGEDLFRKKAENGNKYYYSFEKVAEKLEFSSVFRLVV